MGKDVDQSLFFRIIGLINIRHYYDGPPHMIIYRHYYDGPPLFSFKSLLNNNWARMWDDT
jgi:hypothetical protein